MRKYTLADGSKRSTVDLRNYEDVIKSAVEEFAPGTTVTVCKEYYIVNEQLTQSQAVKIGRRICESDLAQHCIKLSKLFNSREVSGENRTKQKQAGRYNRDN